MNNMCFSQHARGCWRWRLSYLLNQPRLLQVWIFKFNYLQKFRHSKFKNLATP